MWPFNRKSRVQETRINNIITQVDEYIREKDAERLTIPDNWDPGIVPEQNSIGAIISADTWVGKLSAYVKYQLKLESGDTVTVMYNLHSSFDMLRCKELKLAMSKEELPAQIGKKFSVKVRVVAKPDGLYNKVVLSPNYAEYVSERGPQHGGHPGAGPRK
jgi:hypothetical protein